jgi:hypothetical protein
MAALQRLGWQQPVRGNGHADRAQAAGRAVVVSYDLWTASGQLLASTTFTNQTASGWPQANFAPPREHQRTHDIHRLLLRPNGHYSETDQYFDPPVRGRVMLNARRRCTPCNTQATSNGVYIYTKSVTFPSETYNGANYRADTSFTPLCTTSFTLAPLITFLCRTDI